MKAVFIISKHKIDPQNAAVPYKGTAAFSCSTRTTDLSCKNCFPAILQVETRNRGGNNNILTDMHYFRRGRAKHPIPNVVLIEGQRQALGLLREVAA